MLGGRSKRKKMTPDAAFDAAVAALSFLAEDAERLERFLSLSGLGPHNLRQAAADPHFLGAVLAYVGADETLLIAFAAQAGLAPEDVAAARDTLAPERPAEP